MAKKTDNANLAAKLSLRSYFLRKYHATGPLDVMECCQGSGVLWRLLRKQFELTSYWGLDVKPKKGRLSVDSARVLCQAGWQQNIIDIDTYGSPWKHWLAMLPNVTRPLTVFLTIGQWQMGVDSLLLQSLALGNLKVPPGIAVKLAARAIPTVISRASEFRLRIVEAAESESGQHARYIGVRLEKVP